MEQEVGKNNLNGKRKTKRENGVDIFFFSFWFSLLKSLLHR